MSSAADLSTNKKTYTIDTYKMTSGITVVDIPSLSPSDGAEPCPLVLMNSDELAELINDLLEHLNYLNGEK